MATNLPARYKNSSFVANLAKSKDAAVKRARQAKQGQRSTAAKTTSTLAGAAIGGAANAVMPNVFGAAPPAVIGLLMLGAGVGMGSPAMAEAGTGSLCLVVGEAMNRWFEPAEQADPAK